jgi:membrane-associated protein
MNYYKFLSANALGAFLWGVGITLAGFYSGSISWVRDISYFLAFFFIFIYCVNNFKFKKMILINLAKR